MKELLLLRHAKSSWDNTSLSDRERPVSERGIRDAKKMGKYIIKKNLVPGMISSSSSVRTRVTVELVLEPLKQKPPVIFTDELYLAEADEIIEYVSRSDNDIERLMIAGHNPGMEMLVEKLTGKPFPFEKFSTCALAVIALDINDWKGIGAAAGKLSLFVTPKTLKDKK